MGTAAAGHTSAHQQDGSTHNGGRGVPGNAPGHRTGRTAAEDGDPLFIAARSVLTFRAGSRATSARRGALNRDQTSQQGEIMMAIAAMT